MDILTKEECQALIDYSHTWEVVDLIKSDGSRIKFKTADVDVWKNKYPIMLKECIMKYEIGDFCEAHKDSPWRRVSPDWHAISVWITPLNDGYDGGELYIGGRLTEQIVGVPIKMYRTTLHEITEVTNGTRYSQVSWVFVQNKPGSWWDNNKIED